MWLPSRRSALRTMGFGAAAATFGVWPATATATVRRLPEVANWVVFYGQDAELTAFDGFEVIVLDPAFRPDITPLVERGATTLGYISLGEISQTGPYFGLIRDRAVLLRENANWRGSFAVDARRRSWMRLIIDEAIPQILAKGYRGLFLDTLDTLVHLEDSDPQTYRGMRRAAARLVKEIRRAYPTIPLMMNRGYALLPELVDTVDAVLAESFMTTYNFETKTYHWVGPDQLAMQLELLQPARLAPQRLPVYSLDYWNPADPAALNQIYNQERALGHSPYVATILLDQLVPEP